MNKHITIGKPAPLFTASSTKGLINLKDYAGKWVILLCNPTEFNAWRKNEFIYLMKHAKTFSDKGAEFLPVSMDPKATHLQWFYGNARLGTYAMPFPIIDDRNGMIAELYDIESDAMQPSAPTNMHAFIIAPDLTVAKTLIYPTLGGIQIAELLSTLSDLQANYGTRIEKVNNQPQDSSSSCPTELIVGEYVLGNPYNVDAMLLDFAIYAFALINSDGTLTVYSTRYLEELVGLKQENPYLKVILAIGGWGADGFSDAALTPTSRYNFAREAKRWVDEYGLDGIDMDWEYPGSSASGIRSRPQDRENFTLLLTALRDVLGDNAWLSVAGTGEPGYIRNVEIAKIAPIINYFNLMAYDYTAGETGATAARHQSNLYPSELSLGDYSVDAQVNNLINAGMPASQILLGIPFYGRYGATSTVTYDVIRREYLNKNGYRVLWDSVARAPYIVDPDGNFAYSFDNPLSIYYKGLYVAENCLGGMFAWQSSMDQANILTYAMSQAVRDINQLEASLSRSYFLDTENNNS